MVFRAHTVNTAGLNQLIFLRGIGKYGTAVTIAGQRLGRIKRRSGHIGNRTGLFAFIN